MSEISRILSTVFVDAFESILKEFDADDFATMENPDSVLKTLKPGEVGRLATHAGRRFILIGTPLSLLMIGEQYPRDATRIRLTMTPQFAALFPNPLEDYMSVEDFYFYYGSTMTGGNIGIRLENAMYSMHHSATHNPATGQAYNVAMDSPD